MAIFDAKKDTVAIFDAFIGNSISQQPDIKILWAQLSRSREKEASDGWIPYGQYYIFSQDRTWVANSRIYQFLTLKPAFKFQGDEIKEVIF